LPGSLPATLTTEIFSTIRLRGKNPACELFQDPCQESCQGASAGRQPPRQVRNRSWLGTRARTDGVWTHPVGRAEPILGRLAALRINFAVTRCEARTDTWPGAGGPSICRSDAADDGSPMENSTPLERSVGRSQVCVALAGSLGTENEHDRSSAPSTAQATPKCPRVLK